MTDQGRSGAAGRGLRKRKSWFKPLDVQTPLTVEALDKYYAHVRNGLVADMDFLRRPIAVRRFWSNAIKLAGFAALAAGILLPILKPDRGAFLLGGRSGAEIALIAVAAGGLLLLLDRLFNVSGSWTRLMLAELQVQKLIIGLQFDWAKTRPGIGDLNVASDGPALIDLLRTAAVEANAVMEAQKRTWATELDTAAAALAARLDSQQSTLATLVQTQQSERRPGGLNLRVDKPDSLEGPLRIVVNDKEVSNGAPQSSYGLVGLAPGLTRIELSSKRKAPPGGEFGFATAIEVPAGGLAELTVAV